ncbi:MAG: EamA family transporter RarD [Betaproteobacteria bacterium]|nr:EamA family transporter RarD [Betaproteobacteria bacterium]
MHTGLAYALLAFGSWGLFPLYFALIATVPPLEVVLHRSVWSLVLVLGVLAWQQRWAWLGETLRQPKRVALFAASALLLACNWLVYVMAVQTGHVAEASLGYFINPLVNVLLGVLVLHERLRPLQWLAVAVAAAGVLWLTWQGGRLPWIALVLAGSFGLYGLIRKTAPLGALEGLALENLLLAPLAVPALLWWSFAHDGVLVAGPASQIGWLLLSGPLTALPLLWFAGAARRLKLSTLGLVQYLGPTLQLMLAVWVFHEPFDTMRLVGFVMIWSALALVSADALGWRPGAGRTGAV